MDADKMLSKFTLQFSFSLNCFQTSKRAIQNTLIGLITVFRSQLSPIENIPFKRSHFD